MSTRYEDDAYGWANEQAALLRAGRLSEIDIINIAEEIESVGRSERRELESRLAVLLHHFLKWQYQPAQRGKSWRITMIEQRKTLRNNLAENPSLKSQIAEIITKAYDISLTRAAAETDLPEDTFPELCPWAWEEIMDPDFWPESH